MSSDQRKEHLEELDLPHSQVSALLSRDDAQQDYQMLIDRRRFNNAAHAFSEFDRNARGYEIFFSEKSVALIRSICDKMNAALGARDRGIRHTDFGLSDKARTDYEKDRAPLVTELAEETRALVAAAEFSQ